MMQKIIHLPPIGQERAATAAVNKETLPI